MKKQKLLCILHYSPPAHGASKVGDFIKSSEKLKDEFHCKFIKIKSSFKRFEKLFNNQYRHCYQCR